MGCCDDPTEPKRIDRRALIRAEENYGQLMLELFTEDPEKIMYKQLHNANRYLTELAALNAHYPSVRLAAIELLGNDSQTVLKQIIEKYPESNFSQAAEKRLQSLVIDQASLLSRLFKS
jgi:hypothetical protein